LCTFLRRVIQFLTQFVLRSRQLDRVWERKIFEQLNIGILSCVEYQSCTKYCDDRSRQNSAFLHKGSENYGNFGECRLAVEQLGSFSQFGFFGHANLEIHYGVEYQLWKCMKSYIY
jgi:hypothetical protein